jgi:hypothetical protein
VWPYRPIGPSQQSRCHSAKVTSKPAPLTVAAAVGCTVQENSQSDSGSLTAGGTPHREFVKERLEQAGGTPGLTNRKVAAMMTRVREGSRFGSCNLLGELVAETSTHYIYRRRHTTQTALVDKGSSSIHIHPCQACPDYRNAPR